MPTMTNVTVKANGENVAGAASATYVPNISVTLDPPITFTWDVSDKLVYTVKGDDGAHIVTMGTMKWVGNPHDKGNGAVQQPFEKWNASADE